MKKVRTSPSAVICVALMTGVMICCVNTDHEETREVALSVGSIEHRRQAAQAYATEQQLASLRARAKKAFPALVDADLATLRLKWEELRFSDIDSVTVRVSFNPDRKGIDTAAVANYVGEEVLRDLRPEWSSSAHP